MTFRRPRLEFDNSTKREALERSGHICECHRVPILMRILNGNPCGVRLSTGNIQYDHVIANALRPDNSIDNCAVLTKTCHALKTDLHDKKVIAQAKRRSDRHNGIKRTPREALLGTVRSGVHKPMSGGPPIYRDSGRQWPAGPKAAPGLPEPNGIIAGPVAMTNRVPVLEADPVITRK